MANFESFSEDLIPRIIPQPMLHPVLVSVIDCVFVFCLVRNFNVKHIDFWCIIGCCLFVFIGYVKANSS